MHRLASGGLALAVALAQGCIIIDDTDENADASCPERESGACFAVSAVCPDDAVTLRVFTQPVGTSGAFMDEFDCTGGAQVVVDPGTYDVRVEATTAEGDVIFGSEPVTDQEVADLDDVPLDFEFPVGEGFFWLDWTIKNDAGDPLACEDVGAVDLEVESTPTSGGSALTDVLHCAYGGWQTSGLELGEYDVRVSLLDEGGSVLDQTDPILSSLGGDAELVELPAIVFPAPAAAR
jgi:hypothetical protein